MLLYCYLMAKNLKKSKTFRFSDSELEFLESLKGDKTYAETIVDGLRALERQGQKEPSNRELIAMLKARLGDD